MAAPLLFVVSALSFVLVSLTPGDARPGILGTNATPEAYERLSQELGLDQPLYEQYWNWLTTRAARRPRRLALQRRAGHGAISERLPVTLSLMVALARARSSSSASRSAS